MRNLFRAVRLVVRSAPGLTAAATAVMLAQSVVPLLSLYLMKRIVDAVAGGLAAADRSGALSDLTVLIAAAGGLTLVGALLRSVSQLLSEHQVQVVTDRIYDLLHAKSVEIDLECYEDARYHDMLHRAEREAPSRPTQIVQGLIQVGRNGLSLFGAVALLFTFHWVAAAALFAAAAPSLIARLRYADKLYRWSYQRTPEERRARMVSDILTGPSYAKEVRLFRLGGFLREWFQTLRLGLRRERLEITARRARVDFCVEAGTILVLFGLYTFILHGAVQGAITLGGLVMYYQAVVYGLDFLWQALSALAGLYQNNLFLANFYELLDLEPKVKEPPRPVAFPRPIRRGITFEHVGFRYPAGPHPVLEDVNLTIRPGEHIALVGRNGAGKTTLVKLLCRLYDPTAGRIALDGTDLRQFSLGELRSNIGALFQDFCHYDLTAAENIGLGMRERPLDGDAIAAAARGAGAEEAILRLPQGYDTPLGKLFDGGQELSLGEWQKVALARIFLRDSEIVILDEPTSALDPRAEAELYDRFHRFAAGKTAILISHRFSTVKMADRIFVLEGGRIVEDGSHEQLLEHNGAYAGMYETQARMYR